MRKQHSRVSLVALLAFSLFAGNIYAQDSNIATDSGTSEAGTNTDTESVSNEHVARAVFTSGIENREPTDTITSLSNDKHKIYFYSELTGLGGQTVTHRWEYQGKTMGEIQFNIGGPRWRVWSSKTLLPQWTGEWRVSIIDGSGNKVGEGAFNYTGAGEPQN